MKRAEESRRRTLVLKLQTLITEKEQQEKQLHQLPFAAFFI